MCRKNDLVLVKVDFAGFGTGKVRNDTSALVRPFRLLIDEGKPIGRINYLFYRSNRSFVLGSLCLTPGHRLLFFPGLVVRTPSWYSRGKILHLVKERDALIDHLTMEADFASFHATTLRFDSTRRLLSSYKTKRVVEGLSYWFGLSVQSEKVLEECPDEIEFPFSSPLQDSERRTRIVIDSREGAKFHIIELHPAAKLVTSCFLHFDFFVDLRRDGSFEDLVLAPTTAPVSPPALKNPVSMPETIHVRRHPVTIPEFEGIIQVVASVRVGELTDQAVIGGF